MGFSGLSAYRGGSTLPLDRGIIVPEQATPDARNPAPL